MPRLIDADAIKYTPHFVSYGHGYMNDGVVTATEIDAMPTIEPVKHGTWTEDKFTCTCSECGSTYWRRGGLNWNYCPNCGSRNGGNEDGKA